MSDSSGPAGRAIDQVCDAFEVEWRTGRRPPIGTYLGRVAPAQRAELLRELLALEVQYRLRAGERPDLAEYEQRFPDHTAAVRAVFARPVPPLVAAGARGEVAPVALSLTAIEGPHQGQVFTFAGHEIFLAGRSKQAHLRLTDDPYFSRFHFMVEFNPPACRLTDLGSRNRTLVNGQPVQAADLRGGDVIKAGHTVLRLSLHAQAAEPAAATAEARTLDLHAAEALPAAADAAPLSATAAHPGAPESGLETYYPSTVAPALSTIAPLYLPDFPPVAGYRPVRELGRGGMGVVYLAVCDQDGSQVALKTIIPAVAANRNQVDRFLREAGILRQLQHRHIVTCRDVGESPGCLFFAMEYVEGIDAAKVLKKGPLPVREAVRILCQVLLALKYAHDQGFVHRDIKPANILITEEAGKKTVKVADFGLARVYQESRMSGLTMQGDIGGTVAFMPPEQITHFRQVRPAADQYSAAATLYNLLTGRLVFDFGSPQVQPLSMVLEEPPVPIRQRRPDLPEELAAIIHRALAKDPNDRFPDVGALRTALKSFGQ